MSEAEQAFEVVEIKIAKLDLKPGSKLAMICPETWSPRQVAMFQAYSDEVYTKKYGIQLLCLPSCEELYIISPEGGFK